jgi:hypothetical protein
VAAVAGGAVTFIGLTNFMTSLAAGELFCGSPQVMG